MARGLMTGMLLTEVKAIEPDRALSTAEEPTVRPDSLTRSMSAPVEVRFPLTAKVASPPLDVVVAVALVTLLTAVFGVALDTVVLDADRVVLADVAVG